MDGNFENWMPRKNATPFRRDCSPTKRDREMIYMALDRGRNYATKTIWTIIVGFSERDGNVAKINEIWLIVESPSVTSIVIAFEQIVIP
jgi:hypothetical protein